MKIVIFFPPLVPSMCLHRQYARNTTLGSDHPPLKSVKLGAQAAWWYVGQGTKLKSSMLPGERTSSNNHFIFICDAVLIISILLMLLGLFGLDRKDMFCRWWQLPHQTQLEAMAV